MEKIERLVKPWYDALEEGKLLGRKCKKCGHIEFPPRYACNKCGCLETEWTEISGKAKATCFIPQSPMQHNDELTEQFDDFMWATIQLDECEEIDAMNSLVLGVGKDRLKELTEQLPVAVKPEIVQRDGYKILFWKLAE